MDISGVSGASPVDMQAAALSGMADAQNKMAVAAEKMATAPATPEVVLDVSNAGIQFAASAEVLKTSQENTKKLLDVLA
ncbi:MAG TPA: hypothetical protein PKZ97_09740 [Azospirillaceae bacterium]|nr:hypothetical protein [Azospirillaceae bacterium]HRQ81388.1 hypothetical protein [Azospirillaceae bacterium]